jgi:hypothetical protein
VPPLACSILPMRRFWAPVKAPGSWPKSSLSSRVSAIPPQLMATKLPVPARAQVVQAAGNQFLAGAGFAVNQHVGGAAGQTGQAVAQLLHAGGAADQLAFEQVALLQLAAQVAHLQHQPALFQRPAHDLDQYSGGKGFWMKS